MLARYNGRAFQYRIDRLAYLVAEGWTITAAAADMGVNQQMGSRIWARVKQQIIGERGDPRQLD